jgi:hypothetical protein
MSFTFSRALVEAFLRAGSSDGAASAQSNGTRPLDQCWWPDKTTGHTRLSRFGMTCGPLTGIRGEAVLTWWLEASRARTSPSPTHTARPIKAMGSTASAPASGASSSASFAKFDPAELKWKTAQGCLFSGGPGSPEFLGTWPSWGLMRNGECWEAATLEVSTAGSAPGSVPTPVATMSKGSSKASLTRKSGRDRSRDRLDHWVMALDGGPLNPEYAESLMSWPIGLTAFEPLATDRTLSWLQLHGAFSAVNERKAA